MAWTRRGLIGGIVGAVVFLIVVAVGYAWSSRWAIERFSDVKSGPTLPQPVTFDREAWMAGRSPDRIALALGLVADERLLGVDGPAVRALLGPPDDDHESFPWTYVLKEQGPGEMPSPELRLRFEDGVVVEMLYDDVPGFGSRHDRRSGEALATPREH